MSKKRHSKLDPAVIDKERQVLEHRLAGLTFDRISQLVGYRDASGARQAYVRALKRTLQPAADEVRELQATRLEKALEAIWPAVESGDLKALDRFIKISDRQAALLGLDAPKQNQVEVTTYDGSVLRERAAQIIQIVREHGNTQGRVGGEISSS